MRADDDLPWYFGSGPSTWAGDSGIRSTLGAQIAQLEGATLSKATRKEVAEYKRTLFRRGGPRDLWMARPHQLHVVDASQAESDMVERFAAAVRVTGVEYRLSVLTHTQARTLQLHYSGASLPFSVEPAAALLAAARRLCGLEVEPDAATMRAALKTAGKAEREALDLAALRLVTSAREAYENAVVPTVTRSRFYQGGR